MRRGILVVAIALIAFIAIEPRITLVIMSYSYLLSAFIEMAVVRMRQHREDPPRVEARS